MTILVYCEASAMKVRQTSLEAVSAAAALDTHVVALLAEPSETQSLAQAGASCVVIASVPYAPRSHARLLAKVAQEKHASLIIASASLHGKEVAAMCAGYLHAPLLSDCIAIESITPVRIQRPIYAGKVIANITSQAECTLLTLRPHSFTYADHPHEMTQETISVQADAQTSIELHAATTKRKELAEAEIIVSGGRGMGGSAQFKILEDLAEVLDAAVGASRAAVDAGWRPHADQVGQTGKTVSPKLYIACAISGAVQHLAGMRTSKVIVAINKDKEAPIFKVADFGIVGDVFEVVPAITEKLKRP